MLLETLRCERGIALHCDYHQRRLERSLYAIGSGVSYDLSALISPPKTGVWRCRFLYDETGFSVEYLPYAPRTVASLRLVHDDEVSYPLKDADRSSLERLYAQRQECDDVLIVRQGRITDTTIANIALRIGGAWYTPSEPLLEGTTRARLIDEGVLIPAPLGESDLAKAEKIALLNAMTGFVELDNGIIVPN